MRAPGTIPTSEAICVAVSRFAAEIFGCYTKILARLKRCKNVDCVWSGH